MILTLTLNPAIDQTVRVERMAPGAVHRVLQTHIDPAGRGVSVSRMAHRLGWPTIAFGSWRERRAIWSSGRWRRKRSSIISSGFPGRPALI